MADHDRRRALPRLQLGDRGHEHRPRPSAGRRRDPGAGREAPPRPAEHRLPRARAAAVRAPPATSCRGDGWGAFLSNSGAEAVEAAVKLARIATGRPVIIGFRGGYHGRTGQTMALTTAKDVYRGHFEPLPGSVYHTAYPYCYRCRRRRPRPGRALHLRLGGPARPDLPPVSSIRSTSRRSSSSRSSARAATSSRRRGFLPRLREITRQHGILLIADEVQTGFGRTGELFAVRALGRRAGHPRHGQGDRVGPAAVAGSSPSARSSTGCRRAPTAGPTAATSSPAPRPTRRST